MLVFLVFVSLALLGCQDTAPGTRAPQAPATSTARTGSTPQPASVVGQTITCASPAAAAICTIYLASPPPASPLTLATPSGPAPRDGEALLIIFASPKTVTLAWNPETFATKAGLPWPTKIDGDAERYHYWQILWNARAKKYLLVGSMLPTLAP